MANVDFTAWEAPIVDENDRASVDFRTYLQSLNEALNALGQEDWTAPTGSGSRATFNMDWTQVISNPPTQGEVESIRNQLVIVQKRLGQLIIDLRTAGVLG